MLRGYDPNSQQVWQVAKGLAVEEDRLLSPTDLWWGCLAVVPEEKREEASVRFPVEKQGHLQKLLQNPVQHRVGVAPAVTQLDQNIRSMCRSSGAPAATVWHVLLALLEHPDEELTKLWDELGLDRQELRRQVQRQVEEEKLPSRQVPLPPEARRVLDQFTRNLTEAAAQGRLTAAYERDRERAAIVRTLLRKSKRNVALVGPAGVGKTKLVEDLALRTLQGEVPQLAECEFVALSTTALRAGTSLHGEIEQRFEQLRQVFEDYGDRLILFIDELHTIVGTAVSSQSLDLANALKPLLASGQLRCVGATTQQEFIQYVEQDRALARRFQMIAVPEPSRQAMERILESVQPEYEQHHGVRYGPETRRAILDLADVYLPNRYYPDKALDLLDEAGAWVVMQGREEEPPLVTPAAVRAVLSEILLVPLEDLTAEAIPQLAARLEERVVGQSQAMELIQDALIAGGGRSAVSPKPRAAMLFAGPPGVGKTFAAEVLTELLCHRPQAMLDLDLDQVLRSYQYGSSADFLLGPRPPYVGWEHGGVLTNHVLTYPQSVVLVRGAERARPDVQHLFASILEHGECEDGRGQRVPFRGVILVFVVESGPEADRSIGFLPGMGGQGTPGGTARLRERLLQIGLLPDLLRNIGQIVPFQPLSAEALREIARRRLELFRRELYEQEGKVLDVEEPFLARLLSLRVQTAAEAEQQVERLAVMPVNDLRASPKWAEWKTVRLGWEEQVPGESIAARVMVVDDLPDFFQELEQSYPEYQWLYAPDAETATQTITRERPHLVLVDTCFSASDASDIGGVAVLQALKERFPAQSIVLVTAQGVDFETTRQAFHVGAYDYLWKPPQESVLRKLVAALVSQEEQQRRLVAQEQLLQSLCRPEAEEEEQGVRIRYH